MKTFYPKKSIYVKASKPHPKNTQYKVSVGTELCKDTTYEVIKVQMVYNGKVEGRKSPSYPLNSEDLLKVNTVIHNLINEKNFNG